MTREELITVVIRSVLIPSSPSDLGYCHFYLPVRRDNGPGSWVSDQILQLLSLENQEKMGQLPLHASSLKMTLKEGVWSAAFLRSSFHRSLRKEKLSLGPAKMRDCPPKFPSLSAFLTIIFDFKVSELDIHCSGKITPVEFTNTQANS